MACLEIRVRMRFFLLSLFFFIITLASANQKGFYACINVQPEDSKLPIRLTLMENILLEFKRTLKAIYEVEDSSIERISEKLSLFLREEENFLLLKTFNETSYKLLSDCKNLNRAPLSLDDAVIKAPDTHEILFENSKFRILYAKVLPDQTVPFHTHQYDSLFLTLEKSTLQEEDMSGHIEVENCEPMIEYFKGSFEPYSYKNIGCSNFEALVFEIK